MQKQLQHQDKVPSHPNNTWNLTNRGPFTRKMVQNRTPPSVRLHVFLGERVLQQGYAATSTQSPSAPWQPRHSTRGPIYTRTSTSPAATTLWMDEIHFAPEPLVVGVYRGIIAKWIPSIRSRVARRSTVVTFLWRF